MYAQTYSPSCLLTDQMNQVESFLGLGKHARDRKDAKTSRKNDKAEAASYKKKTEADAKILSAQAELALAQGMSAAPAQSYSSAKTGDTTDKPDSVVTDLIFGMPKKHFYGIAIGVGILIGIVLVMNAKKLF